MADASKYSLILSNETLQTISMALGEMPFRLAAPAMNEINDQIRAGRVEAMKADAEYFVLSSGWPSKRLLMRPASSEPPRNTPAPRRSGILMARL